MLRLHSESSRSYTPQGGTELSPGDLFGELSCANMAALCVATCRVAGQESAEVIAQCVGSDSQEANTVYILKFRI
jgi:hypothetical protein